MTPSRRGSAPTARPPQSRWAVEGLEELTQRDAECPANGGDGLHRCSRATTLKPSYEARIKSSLECQTLLREPPAGAPELAHSRANCPAQSLRIARHC